jgi:hypothetical protein
VYCEWGLNDAISTFPGGVFAANDHANIEILSYKPVRFLTGLFFKMIHIYKLGIECLMFLF